MDIILANKQRKVRFDTDWLLRTSKAALAQCSHHSADGLFALKQMPAVEVAIVSDTVIARVHVDFMGIAGATDVITFEHGEIVVSADTAARCGKEHRHGTANELLLYIIHGLLHLNGYDDQTPSAKKAMFKVQERIWNALRAW
jgi:probable rRNA maturation factor